MGLDGSNPVRMATGLGRLVPAVLCLFLVEPLAVGFLWIQQLPFSTQAIFNA